MLFKAKLNKFNFLLVGAKKLGHNFNISTLHMLESWELQHLPADIWYAEKKSRAENDPSAKFHNHGEGPYKALSHLRHLLRHYSKQVLRPR